MALETHALFGQMLPDDFVLQGQVFAAFPFKKALTQEVGVNLNIQKTFATDGGYGRAFTPALELLGRQEMASGAKTEWDLVPQMQVSLNVFQHVRLSVGVRLPVNQRQTRSKSVLTYLLWDWGDGGLFDLWRAQ